MDRWRFALSEGVRKGWWPGSSVALALFVVRSIEWTWTPSFSLKGFSHASGLAAMLAILFLSTGVSIGYQWTRWKKWEKSKPGST